jgi:hypothetical protein
MSLRDVVDGGTGSPQPQHRKLFLVKNFSRAEKPWRNVKKGVFDDSGANFTPETASDFYENR